MGDQFRNGSLDTSFGSGGKVVTALFNGADAAFAVALQPDGKIVLAGESSNDPRFQTMFALVRYNSDGSLDTSFGSGGKVMTGVGLVSLVNDVVIQPDGKIVAAGYGVSGDGRLGVDIALVRYNPDGSLDAGFGSGGVVIKDVFGRSDVARAVTLQRDGKIVVAGLTLASDGNWDFLLARYLGDAPRFDLCVQDDGNGGLLQINTVTGEYQFTNCAGLTIGWTGTITRRGAVINLQHNAAARRVKADIITVPGRATAVVQLIPQRRTFVITDKDITNNTCACR